MKNQNVRLCPTVFSAQSCTTKHGLRTHKNRPPLTSADAAECLHRSNRERLEHSPGTPAHSSRRPILSHGHRRLSSVDQGNNHGLATFQHFHGILTFRRHVGIPSWLNPTGALTARANYRVDSLPRVSEVVSVFHRSKTAFMIKLASGSGVGDLSSPTASITCSSEHKAKLLDCRNGQGLQGRAVDCCQHPRSTKAGSVRRRSTCSRHGKGHPRFDPTGQNE
jgi:hypothetical protein